jgi:hypothetical protein
MTSGVEFSTCGGTEKVSDFVAFQIFGLGMLNLYQVFMNINLYF